MEMQLALLHTAVAPLVCAIRVFHHYEHAYRMSLRSTSCMRIPYSLLSEAGSRRTDIPACCLKICGGHLS